MPYGARQMMLDEPNAIHGLHRYWRSAFIDAISDDLIDAVVDQASRFSSPLSALLFFYVHGAATRVPVDATAFSARRPMWDFDAIGQWVDPPESDTPHRVGAHVVGRVRAAPRRRRRLHQPPHRRRPAGEGARLLRLNLDRLRQLKARYDPTNVFRMNPNISPD